MHPKIVVGVSLLFHVLRLVLFSQIPDYQLKQLFSAKTLLNIYLYPRVHEAVHLSRDYKNKIDRNQS
jgi:hypothetical protein